MYIIVLSRKEKKRKSRQLKITIATVTSASTQCILDETCLPVMSPKGS